MVRKLPKSSGFTLVELLIVVTIIAVLGGIMLMANINTSFQKARDSKRKQDLSKLARIFEDYYNDNQHYPPGNDPADGEIAGSSWGSAFLPYVPLLPKDPLYPQRTYYYQTGPTQNFYVIYVKLENTTDPDITLVGCQEGCGPKDAFGNRAYNYLIISSDVTLLAGIPNGEDPGQDISPGEEEPPPGGGGSEPTSTPAPTNTPAPIPIPTFNPLPPSDPNGICAHNQCCYAHWCGADSIEEGGSYCGSDEICLYDLLYGTWGCGREPDCP